MATRANKALARLDDALAQTHIVAWRPMCSFLRHVVQSGAFAQARLDTGIQREAVLFPAGEGWPAPPPPPPVASQLLPSAPGRA